MWQEGRKRVERQVEGEEVKWEEGEGGQDKGGSKGGEKGEEEGGEKNSSV